MSLAMCLIWLCAIVLVTLFLYSTPNKARHSEAGPPQRADGVPTAIVRSRGNVRLHHTLNCFLFLSMQVRVCIIFNIKNQLKIYYLFRLLVFRNYNYRFACTNALSNQTKSRIWWRCYLNTKITINYWNWGNHHQ
jgi:hypothetical protein